MARKLFSGERLVVLPFIPLLGASVTLYDLAVPDVSLPDQQFVAQLADAQGILRGVSFLGH